MTKSSSGLKAFLVFTLFMGSIAGWHAMNDRPSSMDETKHMQLAMDYHDWFVHHEPLQNVWAHVYPPLYHLSLIPAMSVGVPTEAKAVLTHALYLFFFLLGCLLFGRDYGWPDNESLTAALLTLGYGYVLWSARRALIDFPLLSWTTFTMALLARTRGFMDPGPTLLWGIALGIGALLKFTFVFFFVLPVLWNLIRGKAEGRAKNVMLALSFALLLGGSWYFWNSAYFFDKAFGLVKEVTTPGTDPRTLAGWLFYFKLWPFQLGLPQTIFTAIGVALSVVALLRGRWYEGESLLWMWFLSGYIILSATVNKDPRHTLPILPAAAFLAVRGWGSLFSDAWRPRFLWVAGLGLFGFTVVTYDLPAKENWQISEMGHLIATKHDPSLPFLTVSILSHHPRFFARTFKWTLRTGHLSVKTTGAGTPDASFAEFIFLRHGDQGTEAEVIDDEWRDVHSQSRAFQSVFPEIAHYTLLDKSLVTVYQRQAHPAFKISPLTNQAVADRLAHSLKRWVGGPLKVSVRASAVGLREGYLDDILVMCENCQAKGVIIRHVELDIRRPRLNLYRLWDEDRPGLLAFESVHAKLLLSADAVTAPLSKVRGLSAARANFEEGKIQLHALFHGVPISLTVRPEILVWQGHPAARATLTTFWIAGIPLPGWLIGSAYRQTLWLEPQPSFPGRIVVSRVSALNGVLTID